jgi:8-oxo-dGTP pyrophosphatase MutT (NUDIX family)
MCASVRYTQPMRSGTLCFLIKDGALLLGMKKRGFGAGRWNGLGGKIHERENIEEAALREIEEEAKVAGKAEHLEKMALLKFRSDNPALNWDVHVFFLKMWDGEPTETEEMRPQWFSFAQIPYEKMWIDDRHWLPEVLSGRRVEAEILFGDDDSALQSVAIKNLTE